jgi:small subunit ribosomal protein S21
MPKVEVRKDESFESALRRFKRKIEQEGILKEIKKRKHYEKPSERKRRKTKSKR